MGLTAGDILFQDYLRGRGLTGWQDHEPDLGVAKRPDFVVTTPCGEIVFEVKSLMKSPIVERTRALGSGRAFSMGSAEIHKPIRSAVREAARQLRPLRDTPRALVVVVANPLSLPFDHGRDQVLASLYGDLAVVMPVDRARGIADATAASTQMTRNGRLTNDHPYISGVALLSVSIDGVPFVRVFETLSSAVLGLAHRLPLGVFDGPLDRRYSWDEKDGGATIVEL